MFWRLFSETFRIIDRYEVRSRETSDYVDLIASTFHANQQEIYDSNFLPSNDESAFIELPIDSKAVDRVGGLISSEYTKTSIWPVFFEMLHLLFLTYDKYF